MSIIFLVPVGRVDDALLDGLGRSLEEMMGKEVRSMQGFGEPEYAFDPQRLQYSSTLILRELVRAQSNGALRILGVTECDLFIPMLSFIYGQAQLGGKAAIISLARLGQEFYSMPARPQMKFDRAVKESIHELGHTFGLTHCLDRACPMSLATNIHQLDLKGTELCSGCSAILRENLSALHSRIR